METEVITVHRITLSIDDVHQAIREYIGAYHVPLTLPGDYNMRPIFTAGMFAGPFAGPNQGHGLPIKILKASRVVTSRLG